MTFYYVIFGIVILLGAVFINKPKRYIIICTILLGMIVGCRGRLVGTDTYEYYALFKYINRGEMFMELEPGYWLLNRIVGLLGMKQEVVIFSMSVITITLIFWFIYKHSEDMYLSVIIFVGLCYYFLSFNIARQFVGLSIVLVAIHFYIKGKYKYYFALILLASTFHYAMLGWLFMPLINQLKLNKKRKLILLFFSPLIILIGIRLLMIVIGHTIYAGYILKSAFIRKSIGFYAFLGLKFIMFFFYISFGSDNTETREENVITFSLAVDIALSLLVTSYSFVGRMIYLFEPYIIISFPYILNKRITVKPKALYYVGFSLAGILFMASLIEGNDMYGIIPYTTIFKSVNSLLGL